MLERQDESVAMSNGRAKNAWLQALMLRDPGRWSSRLGALVSWLRMIGRGQRRRLRRAAAGTLAGASGIALMALLAGPMAPPVQAATITVNETTCTLIEAIRTANTGSVEAGCTTGDPSGPDTIVLGANVNLAAKYGTPDDGGVYSGLPTISSDITIESSTGNKFTIARTADDTDRFRIFTVDSSGSLTLRNLTVSNGYAYGLKDFDCCGLQTWDSKGGAIGSRSGDLTIDGVTFSDNQSRQSGGAIWGETLTITVTNSEFTDNTSDEHGGAIRVDSGTLIVSDVVMSGNSASVTDRKNGGAIYGNTSVVIVSDAVMTGNSSWKGGAIHVGSKESELQVTNSVFTGNLGADRGGAVYSDGKLTIRDSQFISNTSDNGTGGGKGGAIYVDDGIWSDISGSTFIGNRAAEDGGVLYIDDTKGFTVTNSIFSGNEATGDNGGAFYITEINDNGMFLIKNTVFSGNRASNEGGAIYKKSQGLVRIEDSTIADNVAQRGEGGGIYTRGPELEIVNSTISGNSATKGGGIYKYAVYRSGIDNSGTLTMTHTTVTGNSATGAGGGLYISLYRAEGSPYGSMSLTGNLISGNESTGTAENEEIFVKRGTNSGGDITTAGNVFGHSGLSRAAAFGGFVPGAGDFDATTDGTPTALESILETTLADNGGEGDLPDGENTLTHNLVYGSPAIDLVTCDPTIDTDQRGVGRPFGEDCDAGAVEYDDVPPSVFVSTWAAGTVDGLSYGPHDILMWDSRDDSWSKWFDGSDAGLNPTTKFKHNINSIWISDTESAEFAVSFVQNQQRIGELGWVDGYDILWWDGDAFSRWFEGEKVGLNVKTQEKIDGLHVMDEAPAWSEFAGNDCDAYLLISTQGPGRVRSDYTGPFTQLKFGGEDVLGFCATNLGPNTTGFWVMVLDGSADGVKKNNIDSISMSDDGSVLYLTSKKAFSVDGASGGHSMVFAFDMAAEKRIKRAEADGDFSGPLFDVYDAGMPANAKVDALHVVGELESDSR